jgi:CRP-like cAMP-binding protein
VQGTVAARRIGVPAFVQALADIPALKASLSRYLFVLMLQLATSVACTRFHHVGPRLARQLLMNHDRAQADRFHLTHAFLADMLGVRRVGVTGAAGELQRLGLIRYHRGEITVVDRPGLERVACSCYRSDCRAYERLLGTASQVEAPAPLPSLA